MLACKDNVTSTFVQQASVINSLSAKRQLACLFTDMFC